MNEQICELNVKAVYCVRSWIPFGLLMINNNRFPQACFDVRAGSALRKKMALRKKLAVPEFMSTHPSSDKRSEHLDFLLPKVKSFVFEYCELQS